MKKYALFAFNGEQMCFAHALLNCIDLNSRGHETKLIIEGSATALIKNFQDSSTPFYKQFRECVETGMLDTVCMACASKMGTLELCKKTGLPLGQDLSGHPSMSSYIEKGYEIITF